MVLWRGVVGAVLPGQVALPRPGAQRGVRQEAGARAQDGEAGACHGGNVGCRLGGGLYVCTNFAVQLPSDARLLVRGPRAEAHILRAGGEDIRCADRGEI